MAKGPWQWEWKPDRTATHPRLISMVNEYTDRGFFDTANRGRLRHDLVLELEEFNRALWRLMDEMQRRKYYAARFAYRHRNEMTPGARGDAVGSVPWPVWFQQIFGDELEFYMAR